MIKWNPECAFYSIRMAVGMTIIIRIVTWFVNHNMGFYEIFFRKDSIVPNILSVGYGLIGSALAYQYGYSRQERFAERVFKSTLLDCAFFSIRITLGLACFMRVIDLVWPNTGFYDLFLSKDGLLPTILVLVLCLIFFGIECHLNYEKQKHLYHWL